MAHLGGEALEAGAGERDGAEQLGVAVAGHDLRGELLGYEPQAGEHPRLELGAGRRVGADRPGHGADGDLRERALQARGVALRLEGEARELDPERGRLRVHAMRAPHAQRVGVLACACDERDHERASARDDHLAGGAQLQRERRVEHVGGGQPEVDPAPGLADGRGEHVHERGHVVLGHELALFYLAHGEARPTNRLQLGLAWTVGPEQAGQLLARRQLDLAPGVHARLVGPQAAELRAGVAADH